MYLETVDIRQQTSQLDEPTTPLNPSHSTGLASVNGYPCPPNYNLTTEGICERLVCQDSEKNFINHYDAQLKCLNDGATLAKFESKQKLVMIKKCPPLISLAH